MTELFPCNAMQCMVAFVSAVIFIDFIHSFITAIPIAFAHHLNTTDIINFFKRQTIIKNTYAKKSLVKCEMQNKIQPLPNQTKTFLLQEIFL